MTLSAISAVLAYTWAASGTSAIVYCPHTSCTPRYEPTAAQYLTPQQVRERWPAWHSVCSACGQPCQVWASLEHFLAGAWDKQGDSG